MIKNFVKKIADRANGVKKAIAKTVASASAASMLAVSAFAEEGGGAMPSFFSSALDVLKTVVILIGGGLAVWGVINLLEGYSNDNPGAKSQGMKQLMAGVGVALVGILLVPQLATLFG